MKISSNLLKVPIKRKKVFLNFLDGLMFDQQDHLEIKNTSELIEYCYKVAGTVGIMMCPILEVDNDKMLINMLPILVLQCN